MKFLARLPKWASFLCGTAFLWATAALLVPVLHKCSAVAKALDGATWVAPGRALDEITERLKAGARFLEASVEGEPVLIQANTLVAGLNPERVADLRRQYPEQVATVAKADRIYFEVVGLLGYGFYLVGFLCLCVAAIAWRNRRDASLQAASA